MKGQDQSRTPGLARATIMGGVIGSAVTAGMILLNEPKTRRKIFETIQTALDSLDEINGIKDQVVEKVNQVGAPLAQMAKDTLDNNSEDDSDDNGNRKRGGGRKDNAKNK